MPRRAGKRSKSHKHPTSNKQKRVLLKERRKEKKQGLGKEFFEEIKEQRQMDEQPDKKIKKGLTYEQVLEQRQMDEQPDKKIKKGLTYEQVLEIRKRAEEKKQRMTLGKGAKALRARQVESRLAKGKQGSHKKR